MIPRLSALALAAAWGCGARPSADVPAMELDGPPLEAAEIVLPEPVSSENDGFGFAVATDLRFQGNRLVVLETGNDRLVVFDEHLRATGYIGREGAGPGELRGAVGLAAWNDEYAVVEVNNARVTVFDASGAYLRSFHVPNGFSNLDYGRDGTIYVAAYDGRNYLLAADRRGTLRPFGERPWELYPDRMLAAPVPRVEGYVHFAVSGTGVYVYDPVLGALVGFDARGAWTGVCALPDHVRRGLVERAALVSRDFGGDGRRARPSITDMSVADDGRLLLLFPNVGAIGLLVDPVSCRGRAIEWAPEVDRHLGGFIGLVREGVLYRLSSDDLRLFRLTSE